VGDGTKERESALLSVAARTGAPLAESKGSSTGPRPTYTSVVDALPVPVLVARGDRISYANAPCAELFGLVDANRLAGRSLSGTLEARVVGERAKKDLLLWLLEGKTASEVTSAAMDLHCGDKDIEAMTVTRRTFLVDQETLALVTFVRTSQSGHPAAPSEPPSGRISETERLGSITQLASSAAQAVNNPLAYIASNVTYSAERLRYISALLDEGSSMQVDDPRTLRGLLLPVLEALGEAHVGAGKASQLIKDLRSLIEQDTAFCPVDVHTALEAALHMAESEVLLRARLRADLEATGFVLGNTARLTQLFLSLIVSRAQSLEGGSPQRFRIDVRSRTEDGWVVVAVSDNGQAVAGLEEAGSLAPSAGQPALDVGATLDMCKDLAASLHGSLEVHVVPDVGTVTTVRLPLKDSSRKPLLASLTPLRPGRRTRVLIVDNEPLIVRALSRLLKADHDVETAGGGHEALDLIQHSGPFDLVLCDLAMPEMNGIELFQQTVQVAPDMGPRFIFVTGGAVADSFHAVLETLPNRILEKPVQPELLREVVGQLLGTRDAVVPAPRA